MAAKHARHDMREDKNFKGTDPSETTAQYLYCASTADLLDAINNTNSSLARNFGAENFIPRNVFEGRIDGRRKCCTAIR